MSYMYSPQDFGLQTPPCGKPILLPSASAAHRDVPAASAGHCTAHAVFGSGIGTHTQIESHLELKGGYVLNAKRDVVELHEQQLFLYGWDDDNPEKHYFDFVTTDIDAVRVAYTVKPHARQNARQGHRSRTGAPIDRRTFMEKMGHITWWAVEGKREYADVRIIDETSFDHVELLNAKIFAAVREPDPEADLAATRVARELLGTVKLAELVGRTGLKARGHRAMVRLIRTGALRQVVHEPISPGTLLRFHATF